MLKRNGEDCEHPVPNYPGLLTTSEYKAYQAVIPLIAESVRLFDERTNILAEIEKQIPDITGKSCRKKRRATGWRVAYQAYIVQVQQR